MRLKLYRPIKELRAFAKTDIRAGGTERVTLRLKERAFAHWSVSKDRWEVTDGIYEIMVGASVADIRLRAKVRIGSGNIELL